MRSFIYFLSAVVGSVMEQAEHIVLIVRVDFYVKIDTFRDCFWFSKQHSCCFSEVADNSSSFRIIFINCLHHHIFFSSFIVYELFQQWCLLFFCGPMQDFFSSKLLSQFFFFLMMLIFSENCSLQQPEGKKSSCRPDNLAPSGGKLKSKSRWGNQTSGCRWTDWQHQQSGFKPKH